MHSRHYITLHSILNLLYIYKRISLETQIRRIFVDSISMMVEMNRELTHPSVQQQYIILRLRGN